MGKEFMWRRLVAEYHYMGVDVCSFHLSQNALNADAAIVDAEMESEEEEEDEGVTKKPAAKQRRGGLSKKYGPWFIWGQLNAWYKQTVYDPTASLSAERRGTISLPDIECAFAAPRSRYTSKVGFPAFFQQRWNSFIVFVVERIGMWRICDYLSTTPELLEHQPQPQACHHSMVRQFCPEVYAKLAGTLYGRQTSKPPHFKFTDLVSASKEGNVITQSSE